MYLVENKPLTTIWTIKSNKRLKRINQVGIAVIDILVFFVGTTWVVSDGY